MCQTSRPAPLASTRHRIARSGVFWITLASFFLPFALDLALSGPERVFGYLAADAFYYLAIAKNAFLHGSVSFDQVHPSNGFHPLWQLLVTGCFAVSRAFGSERMASVLALLLGACAIAGALALLASALCRSSQDGRLHPAFATLPFGGFAIVAATLWLAVQPDTTLPVFGSLWSYVNGMESGIAMLFWAAAARTFVARNSTSRTFAAYGALLAMMVLSRLDAVIIALPLLLAGAALGRTRSAARRSLWYLALAFSAPLLLYMTANALLFGSAIPLSGSQKSLFPRITPANVDWIVDLLDGKGPIRFAAVWRMLHLVGPAVFAGLSIVWMFKARIAAWGIRLQLRKGRKRFDVFLVATALGVLLLTAYNLFYVHPWNQGHWYFPISTLFASVFLVRVVALALPTAGRSRTWSRSTLVVAPALAGAFFMFFHHKPEHHRRYATFYLKEADRVKQFYAGKPPRIVSYDDGIVAYATGFPTMNGFALATDKAAARAKRKGKLLELALTRGYDRIASVGYLDAKRLRPQANSHDAAQFVRPVVYDQNTKPYTFQIEYLAQDRSFAIVRFAKSPPR